MDPRLAAEILKVVDQRFDQLQRRLPWTAYGIVDSITYGVPTVARVFVSGEAVSAQGFTVPARLVPSVGDLVRVVIDPRGDRYIDEVYTARVGWLPYAYPPGYNASASNTATTSLAAGSPSSGAAIIPIQLPAPMRLQSCIVFNNDVTLLRTAEWRIYTDDGGPSPSLKEIVGANGTWSFTAAAQVSRESPATVPGVALPAGMVYLVIRNTHATNTFGIAVDSGILVQASTNQFRVRASGQAALGATQSVTNFTGNTNRQVHVMLRGRAGDEVVGW